MVMLPIIAHQALFFVGFLSYDTYITIRKILPVVACTLY